MSALALAAALALLQSPPEGGAPQAVPPAPKQEPPKPAQAAPAKPAWQDF
jgi:hypothetical protein